MRTLDRQKLDVVNETRSNLLGWRGHATPESKPIEFDWFRKPAGLNSFVLTATVRDYASMEQLLVLAKMEGMNAGFIHTELPQGEQLKRLNQIAIRQMQVLTAPNLKALPRNK